MTRKTDFYWSAFGTALLVGVGCGKIHTQPGSGFSLTVPSSVVLVSGESPQMSFGVSGCDSFDVDFSTDDGVIYPAGHNTVTANGSGQGTAVVTVPSAALGQQPASCIAHLSIFVTCSDAHRTKSAAFDALCAPKTTNTTRGIRTITALFPGTDPLQPNWFADSAGRHVYSDAGDSYYGSGEPTPPLRVALASGAVAYVEGQVNGQALVAVSGSSHGIYTMPSSEQIVDIAGAGTDLLVLSKSADSCNCQAGCSVGATTLSRFESAAGDRVVIAKLPGEAPLTKLLRLPAGRVGFATLGTALPARVTTCVHAHTGNAYYVSDGVTVEKKSLAAGSDIVSLQPNASSYTSAWVSDDTLSWVLAGNPGVVTGSPDTSWAHVQAAEDAVTGGRQVAGVAWLSTVVAVGYLGTQSGTGGFSVDFVAPSTDASVASYEDGTASGTPALVGLVSIGDHLAITTPTGLRVLGSDGSLVGGADPLPTGVKVTAVGIQSGPSAVAVAAGPDIFVFDATAGTLTSALPPPPCEGRCGGPNYEGGTCPATCVTGQWCAAPDYEVCGATSGVLVLDGLVGWWPGDGDADDHIGPNNGVVTGNLQYTDGVVGQAFLFDGNTVVEFGTDGLPLGDSSRTMALWARWDDDPTWGSAWHDAWLCAYGTDPDHEYVMCGEEQPEGCMVVGGGNGGGWGAGISACWPKATWYHFALTYESPVLTLYINGVALPSVDGPEPLATSSASGHLGSVAAFDGYWRRIVGAIDDLRIYDRALTPDEVALLATPP